MVAETQLMTAEELLALPDDGLRHELVRGELRSMPPTSHEHGLLMVRFGSSLLSASEQAGVGEVVCGDPGYVLERAPDTVRAPDVAFSRTAAKTTGYLTGAPDLVVEIVSPNDRYTDLDEKVDEWLAAGAVVVFVVNPRRQTVTEYRPAAPRRIYTRSDTITAEDVLPGWTLSVAWLFGKPAPSR